MLKLKNGCSWSGLIGIILVCAEKDGRGTEYQIFSLFQTILLGSMDSLAFRVVFFFYHFWGKKTRKEFPPHSIFFYGGTQLLFCFFLLYSSRTNFVGEKPQLDLTFPLRFFIL